MSETNSSIEQEIAQLEKQLSERRAALGQTEKPFDEAQGKEILRDVIGEKIQEHLSAQAGISQYQPAQPTPSATTPTPRPAKHDDAAASYVLPELKDKVQELINLVFNKSLNDGIKEVSKSKNPALIDAFHDVLVDELYNVLIERKKLEQVK